MVANFGFNCKNGKVLPILRLHAITWFRITPKLNFCPKFAKNGRKPEKTYGNGFNC